MKWFNNLKIGAKLISGFLVVAIIAGAVGMVGVVNINKIEQADNELYENMTVPISLMSEISTNFQRVRVNIRDCILENDIELIEAKLVNISEIRAEIAADTEKFGKLMKSQEMKDAYATFLKTREDFATEFKVVEGLVRANRDDEAEALIAETGNMGKASRAEQDIIAKIVEMKLADAKSKSDENTATAEVADIMMITAMALGIIIAIGLGVFTSRLISRPMVKLTKAADLLAVGDINVDVSSNSTDEIGTLMKSFEKMVKNIDEQSKAAELIANGDFSMNIIPKSANDVLSISMKMMVDTLKNLVNEAGILTLAAVEGRLNTRGDATKFSGGYKDIVAGVNKTLDAVIAPVQEAARILQQMSEGNLQVRVTGNYMGDHAEIKNALNDTLDSLASYVKEISYVLNEMANSNLDLSINSEYKGDFAQIKDSLNLIVDSLNEVLGDVNSATDQVASGSRQVSDSSMSLSQGATEQASSIEELTASIEQIASQTKKNAQNANQAKNIAETAKGDAIQGNEQMKHMLTAMTDINESSNNISKIIKVIDEIAFQTNILALNAAVEAARAGKHGKGFAVVAEEVRNLAARSANAAKETTDMIEGSIIKAVDGTKIANETAIALSNIVKGVAEAANLVSDIAVASNEQAIGVEQINQGIMQISEVVQTTSATSEETAAASEELSSQADMLKAQVSKFKLKKQGRANSYRGMEELSPEMIKMLTNLNESNKKPKSAKETKSTSTKKIVLSDKEFGKY